MCTLYIYLSFSICQICISFGASFLIQAKIETKALKAKRPGFTDERYNETSYYYDANTSMYYSNSKSR